MYLHIKSIIAPLLGVLYPKRCVACDKVLLKIEKEIGFCAGCSSKVKLVGPVVCMKCGTPLSDDRAELCINCVRIPKTFTQNKAIYQYSKDIKKAMYRFKYGNRRCYGEIFAKHGFHYYGSWIKKNGIEAIIPVPMYKKKERKRGYNQAAVFAKALSNISGIPLADGIVQRNVDTEAMKQLNAVKRKKNLLNAFSLVKNDVQFRKVLLVDDIYTTGTTMDEVAKVLRQGGIDQVYCMSICIGEMQ